MVAYKCDSCGKLYERYKPYVMYGKNLKYQLRIVLDSSDSLVLQDERLDICPDCFAKIADQIGCLDRV